MLPQQQIKPKEALQGKKFRFVVSSAEDAAKIIRERLGETAQVLSVKQVNGKGLARFLTSPQLEIIVMVPKKNDETKSLPSSSKAVPKEAKINEVKEVKETETSEATKGQNGRFQGSSSSNTTRLQVGLQDHSTPFSASRIMRVLSACGLETALIEGIKEQTGLKKAHEVTLAKALTEVSEWFKAQYKAIEIKELSARVAFLGLPGSGITSSLCKQLSQDVFIRKKDVKVFKLEGENPNPDDALRMFCEVMGISILKKAANIENLKKNQPLYFDVPGPALKDKSALHILGKELDFYEIDSRVLVINAAYESEVIKRIYTLGDTLKATHVVFTHMDEIENVGKLWPFLLKGKLSPLFLGLGQDVTSDIETHILDFFMKKTFPQYILN